MNVGIPRERRPFEFRVGLPPAGVNLFCKFGHKVYVESGAGEGAGFSDEDYTQAGASIVYTPDEAFGRADLVLKFSRPLHEELLLFRQGTTFAGFLHLAAARQDKIDMMLEKELRAIAYEQIEEEDGYRPVLAPLSQIGGRMAAQIAARLMQNDQGGRGILLGGATGVPPAEVVIIGAGVVGSSAADAFMRIGAHVTILDINLRRLRQLTERTQFPLVTMLSTPYNIQRACSYADVLVGAVLVPGERAPSIVTREVVRSMKPRSLIIDMSIDQGGCVETSRPTSHGVPTFEEEGIIHYCVPNISGVLGRTATHALFMGAYPYLKAMAEHGIEGAVSSLPALQAGINVSGGKIIHLPRLVAIKGQKE
jgi:alanine dehydrogenase